MCQGRVHTVTLERGREYQIHVSVGDTILIRTESYPLIPSNLRNTFDLEYPHNRLQLVSETPHSANGRIGKQFLFKAAASGTAYLVVNTREDGRSIRSSKVKVIIQ